MELNDMALLYGTIHRTCPFCGELILPGEAYVEARTITGSPINGMTLHADCAVQRDQTIESRKTS